MTYSAKSGEFLVNTVTTGDQTLNSIEALADGRYVALFSDLNDPAAPVQKGRFFTGITGGNEIAFAGSASTAELASGRFVSVQSSPSLNAVSMQFFGRSLTASGDPIVITTDTDSGQRSLFASGALAQPAGGFVVGWLAIDVRGTTQPILYQQAFDAAGRSVAGPVASPGLVPGGGTALSDGRLALFDPAAQSILIFAANLAGTPQVIAFDGAANDAANPAQLRIEALQNGRFVVVWAEGTTGSGPLHAQVFSTSGVPQGDDIIIDPAGVALRSGPLSTAVTTGFDVAALSSGDFAVTWARNGGNLGSEIAVKTFSALGEEIGFQQAVNTTRAGDQSGPVISARSNGGFVIGWNDQSQTGLDTSGLAVRARVFGTNAGSILPGTSGADVLTGTARDDTLSGLSGNDTLAGLGGTDTASYAAAASGVKVSLALTTAQNTGGAGTDTLTGIENLLGSRYNDTLIGDARRNVLTGSGGMDRLDGGAGNDRLVGGSGSDVLKGGVGADVMIGGTGNDIYYVDDSGDQVIESRALGAGGAPLGGTDTVVSVISYALPDTVEVLRLSTRTSVIDGSSYIDGTGNAGNNTIIGNGGFNRLDGGGGNDRLTGGLGVDLFILDGTRNGTCVITDFRSGQDVLGFRDTYGWYAGLDGYLTESDLAFGTAATTADQHLIFDSATSTLYFDIDGVGGEAQVTLAVLLGNPGLQAYDIMLL